MTQNMRIGLLTPGWPGENTANGIATSVFHLAKGMQAIGHTPVILTGNLDGEAPPDISYVEMPQIAWSLKDKLRARLQGDYGIYRVNYRHEVQSLIAAIKTAHTTYGLDMVIMEETLGWAGDVIPQVPLPVVICLHGPWLLHKHIQSIGRHREEADRDRREEIAFSRAAGLLSPSKNVMEAVESTYDLNHIPRQVISNSYWTPKQLPNGNAILFVGRYDRHKGGDTVLQALDILSQKNAAINLSFVGPDRGVHYPEGQVEYLEEARARLAPKANNALAYLGPQTSAQITKLRQSHGIALIASRYENLNYTLLEAMGAGQAIVSTQVGGPGEVLRNEETALLVPPENPAAMAEALHRLITDPALANRLGTGARATLEQEFHPNVIAEETVKFCQKVLAQATH